MAYVERVSFVRRDMENAPEPQHPKRGASDPDGGNGSHPLYCTHPSEYTEEIRHWLDGGVTPGMVHEAYGAGQSGRLSGQKIRHDPDGIRAGGE